MLQPSKPQAVVIVGWGTIRNDGQIFLSTIRESNGVVHTDPTFPTNVQQAANQPIAVTLGITPQRPLPVAITGIKAGTDWDPIHTKVDSQEASRGPGK
jgi:hypothetical protein